MSVQKIKQELNKLADKKQARILQRFFKTGKGEYAEGDIFLGIKVPVLRQAAKKYANLKISDTASLLKSKIHEYRLTALFILIIQYNKSDEVKKRKIYNLYLKNTKYINNWDLIDLSAPAIVGDYLLAKDKKILSKLAKSKSLWERRIAILATYAFIRQGQFKDTLKIAKILLKDKHDLIHKAVGWMLREAGNRDRAAENNFLRAYYGQMPRVMLRYAIEKFPEKLRKHYLKREI